MIRHILAFGLLGGALLVVLDVTEYHFLLVRHLDAAYAGVVAVIFVAVGLWLGYSLHRAPLPAPPPAAAELAPAQPTPMVRDESQRAHLGITARELEVLQLISEGLSTRDIAGRIFVSENTVKTHVGRLFDKLGARRRTQAVQRGRELGLLPWGRDGERDGMVSG